MDRIRDGRRAAGSNIPNGLSRRRHRTSSFRDSPEDEAEMHEPARLRERGVKKDRERDRDRERERSRSSKRRRADRLMNAADESSEEDESVNDEEEEDDDVSANFSRMLPPLPTPILSQPSISSNYINNNHNNTHSYSHSHHQNLNRKSLLADGGKVFKAVVPAWKAAADEMIGVSVPRKARTASTKRSHDWVSGGGGGDQMNHRQASSSPVRGGIAMSMQSGAVVREAAPLSPPSSSNVSIKKKIKPSGGMKPRPQPRSATTSKSSSSNNNPEELEIEIAEVLYGLMTQSQAPPKNDLLSKNEFNNKSSSEAKSRASSPVSNSSSAAPITAVAPKRKKPRQLVDNNLVGSSSTRNSPAMKLETDQTTRSELSPPNLERNFGSAAEKGESANSGKSGAETNQHLSKSMKLEASTLCESALMEEAGESRDVVPTTKEEVNFIKKDLPVVKLKDDPKEMIVSSMETSTNVITETPAIEKNREEKYEIDLMAPPPQSRSSPERDRAVSFMGDRNRMVFDMEKKKEMSKAKETDKLGISKEDIVIQSDEKVAKTVIEEVEFQKSVVSKERNIELHFDLEKTGTDTVNNPQNDHVVKSQLQYSKAAFKEEQPNTDKSAQSISLPLPMSVASWPGGIRPPIGYMAPLQGVVSVEGGTMPSAPVQVPQPLFSQPRPKRCATHCHIARNIHYYQQLMKMNPFWPAPSGTTASMFGAKSSNLNLIPPTELHGNSSGRSLNSVQDKGNNLAIFPGSAGKEIFAQPASIADSGHAKQHILLQQAMPPVPPNNMMHGPAFIFPFNQQQAAVVATSGRPASAKSPTTTGGLPSPGAPNSATVTASAPAPASALGFNYPNMAANETQYLVLQNSPYPFPIPAVGAPPNFRGHAQPMPMFNGSFYPSQMIHPLQLQQQQAPTSQQQQQIQQSHQSTGGGSTSSQKHLQSQQHRPQGIAINSGETGNGVLQNFAAPKSRSSQHSQQHHNQHIPPSQARQLESDLGGEDSPSTADSRGSRAPVNVYSQNFAMPIHPQNFALMSSSAASAGATGASGGNQSDKKQTHQHQGFKSGVESLSSQAFAMSFGPMIGSTSASGIDLSSMSQNHAILQSLPEATRHSYHQMMQAAATAQAVQQKKNSRMSEDGKIGGAVASNAADEERKVLTGKGPASSGVQSISFSRPDFADASESATPKDSASNSMARMLNLAPGATRMPNVMNLVGTSNSQLHAQLQHQQQLIQMHNQQQHQQQQQLAANVTARSKTPTSNGIASSEHLTSSSVASKFPNSISGFPPNFVQSSNNSSPTQSSQWKNSNRTPTSQVQSSLVSSTSSPKNHQQQQTRTLQNHTQISFGTNQKPSASQGQQHPNSSQSPSPPVAVGSPTHSSLSKGSNSSPRINTASTNKTGQASTLASQQAKNSTSVPSQKASPAGGRNVPSVLGNPHSASLSATTKTQIQMQQLQQQQRQQQQFQQQLSKQTLQQAMFFSNPYFQGQPPNSASSNTSAASGYNLQRRQSEQPQQSQQSQGSSPSSSGMLSMGPPPTQSNTSTTDPAKAAAAAAAVAAAASSMKGGGFSSQGILHSHQFGVQSSGNSHQVLPVGFSYGHIPAAVQVKPAEPKQPAEQKQPAA